ncbi:MAG TPA: SCP2 sterol-binding domain-containing protein [Woeseiaceae bacterium]|nr:SCP2 sterol-binding domain-containing protein [Woeseiaceae bacterium]
MDALERLLAPVIAGINRQIADSTPARELCDRLDGRRLAIRVRDTGLAVCLRVAGRQLFTGDVADSEPDAVITGSLLSLGRLAGDAGEELIRDGTIALDGSATVADDFRRLLRYGRPDWEEQLSRLVGDVAAHGIGDIVRSAARWGSNARRTFEQNIGEYLQEESRALPSRYEVDAFRERVHALRDDAARLDARLARLERAAGGD